MSDESHASREDGQGQGEQYPDQGDATAKAEQPADVVVELGQILPVHQLGQQPACPAQGEPEQEHEKQNADAAGDSRVVQESAQC